MSRKQTPSLQKKAQTKPSGRSEELDEIIDRMPSIISIVRMDYQIPGHGDRAN